jgi:hypothetical protein
VISPPETASVLLVIDVIGRNPGVKLECHARGFIDPELDNRKKRSGLSAEKRVKRVPAGRASPKRGARTKRKIKHGKERNLLVDESANVGQQG